MLGSPLHIGSAASNLARALARCQSQDRSSISTLKVLVKQRVDLVGPELWVSPNEVPALGMSEHSHVLFTEQPCAGVFVRAQAQVLKPKHRVRVPSGRYTTAVRFRQKHAVEHMHSMQVMLVEGWCVCLAS